MSFTSGPWTVTGTHITVGRRPLAETDLGAYFPISVCRENALMIGAAPDSHAANRKIIRGLKMFYSIPDVASDDWIYDTLGGVLSDAYFSARAAIAKATGKHK